MTEPDDRILVERCLNGNNRAFEVLIDRYQKPLFNIASRMVKGYEDAQDITQTVFLKAYENLNAFNPKHKFFSWIYRMQINKSLNFINKSRRFDKIDKDYLSKDKNPEENYSDIELSQNLQNALMDLKEDYRAIIILKHFHDISYKELSYIMNIPTGKVKSRLFSARQLLRDILLKKGLVADAE